MSDLDSALVTASRTQAARNGAPMPSDLSGRPNPLTLLPKIVRASGRRMAEIGRGPCVDPGAVPSGGARISTDWLSGVLGEAVSNVRYDLVSTGTSERGRLRFVGADGTARQMFVKSTPTLLTRIANGATGTSRAEVAFFRDLRKELGEIDIPQGYHSKFDPPSLRSIHLLEDLVHTASATFPTAADRISRSHAESAVDLLATVHSHFGGLKHDDIPTYRQWWTNALKVANVRSAVRRVAEDDFCPPGLRSAEALWNAAIDSITLHDDLPATLLHGDPHLGNWYFLDGGRMGLLDWQCVSVGHWSRDVGYALATLLSVEQRREWEDALIERYHSKARLEDSLDQAKAHYRAQIPGALLMWAPTLHRPRGFPEMQPAELSRTLLTRILAAIEDHAVVRGADT